MGASFGLGAWYLATHPGPALAKDVSSLPEYSKEEVAKHRTPEDRVWVTYKEGVYDITDWVDIHPGGKARLMMAAGSAIDPFWSMYQQHNTQQVRDILEGYRIGSLEGGAPPPPEDPYADDPKDRCAGGGGGPVMQAIYPGDGVALELACIRHACWQACVSPFLKPGHAAMEPATGGRTLEDAH